MEEGCQRVCSDAGDFVSALARGSAYTRAMMRWLRPIFLVLVFVHTNLLATNPAHGEPLVIPTYVAPPLAGSGDDGALAQWALQSWQRASNKTLQFVPAAESSALLRLYWVDAGHVGGFGEMRPIRVNGRPGAAVYVNIETGLLGDEIAAQARADRLYRDSIVYLTCVHELGHGIGLLHTADYQDIMYSFQYGGDIPAYFGRYRRRLQSRASIASTDALSAADVGQLRQLFANKQSVPPRITRGLRVAPAP